MYELHQLKNELTLLEKQRNKFFKLYRIIKENTVKRQIELYSQLIREKKAQIKNFRLLVAIHERFEKKILKEGMYI